jgi:hypothetical protein
MEVAQARYFGVQGMTKELRRGTNQRQKGEADFASEDRDDEDEDASDDVCSFRIAPGRC